MKNIRGIIFDFDGVIVDTEWAIYSSWVRLYQREGVELSIETYAPCLGAGYTHWDPAKHLEDLTGKRYDWDAETPPRQAELEAELSTMGMMRGVKELLDWSTSQGIGLCVASSSSRRWVGGWIQKLGIESSFKQIFCRTDGYPVKPNPALFLAAQEALGLEKDQCLIIEDSENGTIAAHNAGIACAAIPNRMTAGCNFSKASYQYPSLEELLKALQG